MKEIFRFAAEQTSAFVVAAVNVAAAAFVVVVDAGIVASAVAVNSMFLSVHSQSQQSYIKLDGQLRNHHPDKAQGISLTLHGTEHYLSSASYVRSSDRTLPRQVRGDVNRSTQKNYFLA